MTNLTNKVKKIFYLSLLFLISNFANVSSEIYNEIKVEGNERLSVETIIMFSGIKVGTNLEDDDLNLALKNLYKTNYFEDVKIETSNNLIQIKIVENPIIQSIVINGVKNKSIKQKLKEIVKKSEKYPFLLNKVKEQENYLLNIVRSSGFYFASIDTKIINNDNNSIDLFYDFKLGDRAIIKKINF